MFVIYVQTGREDEVLYQLRQLGYIAYVPKRILKQRRKGVYYQVPQILFTGYVFINHTRILIEDYYKIRSINGVVNFLSYSFPLSETEAEYIKGLCNGGKEIGISKGILIDSSLRITEGFLKQYEHKIVKYSRRQHRATVELTLYGKPHRIVCGIDIETEKEHKEKALVDSLPALCRNGDTMSPGDCPKCGTDAAPAKQSLADIL